MFFYISYVNERAKIRLFPKTKRKREKIYAKKMV